MSSGPVFSVCSVIKMKYNYIIYRNLKGIRGPKHLIPLVGNPQKVIAWIRCKYISLLFSVLWSCSVFSFVSFLKLSSKGMEGTCRVMRRKLTVSDLCNRINIYINPEFLISEKGGDGKHGTWNFTQWLLY